MPKSLHTWWLTMVGNVRKRCIMLFLRWERKEAKQGFQNWNYCTPLHKSIRFWVVGPPNSILTKSQSWKPKGQIWKLSSTIFKKCCPWHRPLESRYLRGVKVCFFGHIDEGTEYTVRIRISVFFRSSSMVLWEIHPK